MTSIARNIVGTLRLQRDLLKTALAELHQAEGLIHQLKRELAYAQAANALLEARMDKIRKQQMRIV